MNTHLMLSYVIYAICFPHTNLLMVHTHLNRYYHGKKWIIFTMVAIQIDEQSYISFAIWIRSTVIYMGKEEFFL